MRIIAFTIQTYAVPIQVVVPDVRELAPADAATILTDISLVLSDETPPGEEGLATPGTIIRQDPAPGARVDPGTVVRVVLATQTIVESEATEGTIVGQAPAAGDRAPLYGTVDIELATPITTEVPNLVGRLTVADT
ncbi:MAG: PASTA domain-containing protein [Anaerolineae bacterium]